MTHRVVAIAVLIAAVGACGGNNGPSLPVAATLNVDVSTDAQMAFAGSRLARPLGVYARAADGTPVTRAAIRWTAPDGAALRFSDSVTVTDGNGRAEVSVVLPTVPGSHDVRGSLVDRTTIVATFSVTALTAPALTGVEPTNFAGGDTVIIRGTDLVDSLRVEIGGALATLVASGAPTELTLVVPPCRVPGAVTVLGRFGGGVTNSLTATYAASQTAVALGVGEWLAIDPAQVSGCASFPPAGSSGAEYLLTPQSVTTLPDVTVNYRLSGDSIVTVVTAPRPPATATVSSATRFHDFLRTFEQEASRRPVPPQTTAERISAAAAVNVGDTHQFSVCSALPCLGDSNFTTVTAVARYVGTHAAIFEDQTAPAGGFADGDFSQLGALFEDDLYEVATRAFGAESDVDQNDLVFILLTPVVNGLTDLADCQTAVITGFFFALDVDPAYRNDPHSNRAEVFYAMTPDPNGTVTCALTASQVRQLVPVTFVHEFQHMISYNQHRLLRGANSEVLWLNEGMSHLSEELAAQHFAALGDQTRFSQFALGDLIDAYQFLEATGQHPLLTVQGTSTLPERGAAWLFLRWLLDQFGDDVTRRLDETSRTGADNVAAAVGEPFDRLLTQWFLANYVSDLPGFSAPPRLRYVTWLFRSTFSDLHQQRPDRFPAPFPLSPPQYPGGTFDLTATMLSGSGGFVRVTQGPGQRGFALQFQDASGGPLGTAGQPRLGVIRIR